ncbi:DUF481 domain-containing protein [Leptotrichia sp. OH3620_COT-345]|uniref:DUF481 domain-containing protein n=1 Tax=Leptotrichia sp. OH3620_COT-345 TaxID=2491048 RepID=UPI000F65342F|nr:DUF481 domain-containing protein [Leptotrichia sp. OH3620_COT-345]RRD39857.1 DUF481 domain-containing protein [Leptotrichia sp. OH3620_COT-345]
MVRRIILPALAAIFSINAMADEFFLGGHYNFQRKTDVNINGTKKISQGFNLRAEWLPFEKNNFKVGAGVAYEFNFKQKNDKTKETLGNIASVYGGVKPEWKINSEWKVYNKYKLGLSFSSEKNFERMGTYVKSSGIKSRLYTGIEAGFEWKNFSLGLIYDIDHNGVKYEGKSSRVHQLGITIGYVFDNGKTEKSEFISMLPVKTVSGVEKKETPQSVLDKEEKNKEINKKTETDYRKWFSFDEEINK